MEQEKEQAVALMRYSAIAPLITGTQDDYESLSAYFRTTSAKGIKAPDGSLRHYSPGTLEKWYLSYRKSGFTYLYSTVSSNGFLGLWAGASSATPTATIPVNWLSVPIKSISSL